MWLPLLFAFFVACSAESVAHAPGDFAVDAAKYTSKDSIPCNSIALQACQTNFNNVLGIDGSLDWHNATDFYYEINRRLYNNTQGLLQVCRAYTLLFQCLGQTYSSCINPLYFIYAGYGVNQAFQYVQAIHALQFKCGGGFEQSVMKWAGIINIFNTQQAVLNACFSDFVNSINANFSNYCTAVFHLENCFGSVFRPLGSEIVWWACEDIRVGFSYTFCPDSGLLVCKLSRFFGDGAKTAIGDPKDDIDENGVYKITISKQSQVILDYPPPDPIA